MKWKQAWLPVSLFANSRCVAPRSNLCVCVRVSVFSFKCLSKGRLIASFNVYISNKFMDSVYYDGKEITFHIVNRFAKYLRKTRRFTSCVSKTKACERWKTDSNGCSFAVFCAPTVVVVPIFIFGVHTNVLLPFRHFFLRLFSRFSFAKYILFPNKSADSMEIPLSTKNGALRRPCVWKHTSPRIFIHSVWIYCVQEQRKTESSFLNFVSLLLGFTWATWSWMVYILYSFLWLESETHIDFPCRPQSHSKFRFIDECFHFHFFSVRTFVRSLVYPSSAYITYYNFLFVLPEFCLWVRACVRVFIYICLCARNHAHFFVLFCYFFFIRIRLTLPPSLSHTLTPCSGSERLFHFYPYCYICIW